MGRSLPHRESVLPLHVWLLGTSSLRWALSLVSVAYFHEHSCFHLFQVTLGRKGGKFQSVQLLYSKFSVTCRPVHLRRPKVLALSQNFHFTSVTQSCPTLCDPMDCSMPGLPVHHQLPELAQTQVHQVSDAVQLQFFWKLNYLHFLTHLLTL